MTGRIQREIRWILEAPLEMRLSYPVDPFEFGGELRDGVTEGDDGLAADEASVRQWEALHGTSLFDTESAA